MKTKYSRTLSEKESRILSDLSYKNKTVFSLVDIKEYVEKPKTFLDKLVRKKWILKIRKGIYVIIPLESGEEGSDSYTLHSFVIASLLTTPYYIGYLSALNHHGLTEQTPTSVYIATPQFRRPRKILDTKFVFVTIKPEKFFGMKESIIENRKIMISSPEKTIVDCLDLPQHSGGINEITKSLFFAKDEIKPTLLIEFAKKLGNTTVIKRLGYIAEIIDWKECLELASEIKLKSGYSLLDPTNPKRKGKIKERWKLFINTTLDPKRFMQ